MIDPIGELLLADGKPLVKMWTSSVPPQVRPFLKHAHTQFEITLVNSGSGEYTTDHGVYPILPGDIFVFSSNEIHYITQIHEESLSITNLHFEPYYLSAEFTDERRDNYLHFCFSHSQDFCCRIPGDLASGISSHYKAIRDEFLMQKQQYPLAIRSHLHLILIELLRTHSYGSLAAAQRKQALFDMLAVYQYIDQHLGEELSLQDLAATANLSPNYFSHIFKELHGISLWDYIHTKRIEKATSLLRSDQCEMSMLEVALECGFNNTVHFNKIFKKVTGITPGELRKNPYVLVQ